MCPLLQGEYPRFSFVVAQDEPTDSVGALDHLERLGILSSPTEEARLSKTAPEPISGVALRARPKPNAANDHRRFHGAAANKVEAVPPTVARLRSLP